VPTGSATCSECDASCKTCSGTSVTCTECVDSLFLVGSSCLCSDSSLPSISLADNIVCGSYMDVTL